ncbi:MAG: hypothetical protein P8Y00_02820, partial [Deltaproteobacteria bacterium]
ETADAELMVKADFFVKVQGAKGIIDFSGLGEKMVTFLKEHGFRVLSLHGVKDPIESLSRTLSFLGVPFEKGPLSLLACKRDRTRNIEITLEGISFKDAQGKSLFATKTVLPDEIIAFVQQNGYEVLDLRPAGDAAAQKQG